jgi:hypothetical protein
MSLFEFEHPLSLPCHSFLVPATAADEAQPSKFYEYEPGESYVSGTHRSYMAKRDMKQSYGLTKLPSVSAEAAAYK